MGKQVLHQTVPMHCLLILPQLTGNDHKADGGNEATQDIDLRLQ